MKLPSLKWKLEQPADILRLARWCAAILLGAYLVSLALLMYRHIIPSLFLPREIDPAQVISKQEKLNRGLLEQILERNKAKNEQTQFHSKNPFQ